MQRAAEERARQAAKEAKRSARTVASFQRDERPAPTPRVAAEVPVAAEIAEPPNQEELKDATSLPIYGWFEAPALRKEALEPDAFKVRRRAGSR